MAPVEAATVILIRAGSPPGTPWECFMVRRHVKSEFAADVYVFPGGKVDKADRAAGLIQHCAGVSGSHPSEDEEQRALRLAAIRELFEEVGVLLAEHRGRRSLDISPAAAARRQRHRQDLHDGTMTLLDLAQREDLMFKLDGLAPISRWITPEVMPRRFDTWFFVARMPEGQIPAHDQRETTAGIWISPSGALRRFGRGEFPLVWATEMHLERLATFSSIDALLAATIYADLAPVTPKIVDRDGTTIFLLPGDEGY